ncbi:MAG TPA: hypothetical protein VL688_09790 [Verrucomicrobiae bacterium]|nr:hypothetical protein [Verrucomicrobiae bacterium]
MNCRDVEMQVRPLLEDLLAEEEYQEAHRHIESCPNCRQYVSAIGSISHMLKELGDIPAPRDLADSILFRLQSGKGEAKAGTGSAGRRKFHPAAAAAAVTAILVAAFFLRHGASSGKKVSPAPAQAGSAALSVIAREIPTDEAAQAYEKLKTISNALETVDRQKAGAPVPIVKSKSLSGPAVFSAGSRAGQKVVSVHWDFSPSDEQEGEEMFKALEKAGLPYVYKHPDFAVVRFSPPQFEEFVQETKPLIPGAFKDANFDAIAAQDQVQVSVYAGKSQAAPDFLHWHAALPLRLGARLRDTLLEMGATLDFDSPGLVIAGIPSSDVKALSLAIQALEGVSVESPFPSPEVPPGFSYRILVSIFLTEA